MLRSNACLRNKGEGLGGTVESAIFGFTLVASTGDVGSGWGEALTSVHHTQLE